MYNLLNENLEYGYNIAIQDLKSKIPDLIEQIEECRPLYRKDNTKRIFDNKK